MPSPSIKFILILFLSAISIHDPNFVFAATNPWFLDCNDGLMLYRQDQFARSIIHRPDIGSEIYVAYGASDLSALPEQARSVGISPIENDVIQNTLTTPTPTTIVSLSDGRKVPLRDVIYFESPELVQSAGEIVARLTKKELLAIPASNYGQAKIVDSKLTVSPFQPYTQGLLDHLKNRLMTQLVDDYRIKWKLPKAVWMDLILQEFALASARTFEIAIIRGPNLMAYIRFYLGNQNLPLEIEKFGSQKPVTRISYFNQPIGDFPTHLLPIERTLKSEVRGSPSTNPIAAYRDNPQFKDFAIFEVGRVYINPTQSPQDLEETKKILFTTAKTTLEGHAPNHDLAKVLLFANAGPAGARHYQNAYGFIKLPNGIKSTDDLESIHNVSINRGPLRLNIQFASRIDPSYFEKEVDGVKDIAILGTTGDLWANTLAVEGYILNNGASRWEWFPTPIGFTMGRFLAPKDF